MSSGYVEDGLFENLVDWSRISYSSQVWSERCRWWRLTILVILESRQGAGSEVHECENSSSVYRWGGDSAMAPRVAHTLICLQKTTGTVHGRLVRGLLLHGTCDINFKTCSRVHQNTPFSFKKVTNFLGRGLPSLDSTPSGGWNPLPHLPPSAPTAPRPSLLRFSTLAPFWKF